MTSREDERTEKGKREKEEEKEDEEPEGIAGRVLEGLSEAIPGLGGLIKGLKDSEAFQERLKAIDKEIEARLREEPLKREEKAGKPRAFRSIPPAIPRSILRRSVVKKPSFGAKPDAADREFPADVFDEGNYLRVIAELPGLEEKDIQVGLKTNKLTISADAADRKYRREVELLSIPKGVPKTTYKNGILEIRIEK